MGEMIRVVELGHSYWLEYQTESTGWQMKTKELTPHQVRQYEELMGELQGMEKRLLTRFEAEE